jgi:hypothetical protein
MLMKKKRDFFLKTEKNSIPFNIKGYKKTFQELDPQQ